MKLTEEEHELWDSDLQKSIKLIMDCKEYLESKSKDHFKYEIEQLVEYAEKIFNICYDFRKENVER